MKVYGEVRLFLLYYVTVVGFNVKLGQKLLKAQSFWLFAMPFLYVLQNDLQVK